MKQEKTKEKYKQITPPESVARVPGDPAVQVLKNDPAGESEIVEPYKIYNNNIELLVDELTDSSYTGLTVPELKQDKSFFPCLVNYIYQNYIGDLLHNKLDYKLQGIKPRYDDIKLIDNFFNIYIGLVYKYKFNNRPSITEFSLFTGISTDTIYKWLNGNIDNYILSSVNEDKRRYITSEYADVVKKWQTFSEQALTDGSDIMSIFLLKAKYGYKENNDIQITVAHKNIIDADNLPDLIGINSNN